MTLATLLTFALTLAAVAVVPGPSIAALVSRTLSRGAREVLPFLAAMWLGDVIWLSLAIWGLAALVHLFSDALVVIRWLGAAYLAVLAWRMWREPVAPGAEQAAALPQGGGGWRMFAAGLAVTMGNPKIMMFYLALLPAVIDLHRIGPLAWAELAATIVVVLAVIDLGWVMLALRARAALRSTRARRAANRMGAGVMAAAAAAIVLR